MEDEDKAATHLVHVHFNKLKADNYEMTLKQYLFKCDWSIQISSMTFLLYLCED